MNTFQKLLELFDEELYSNVNTLAQFYLTNPSYFNLNQEEHFLTFVLNACSLWEMKHYAEAKTKFETAILMRRQILKDHKIPVHSVDLIEKFTEIELKFRSAKCMVELGQFKEASSQLQAISLKQRTAKINMLLVKIQQGESGTDKHLISNYKEVLRKCPLAFDCIDGLLSLGVKGSEVNSLVINASSSECFEWVNTYIKGVSEMYSRKHAEAVMSLASIECLKNNPKILAMIGETFFGIGDYERANTYLKRSFDLNPFMKQGIQKYAMICEMLKKTQELELLLRPSSTFPYDYTSENWFVMSIYLYSCMKFEKAQYFINRVILQHDCKNVDALILNAKILHSTKKSNEALISLRSALKHEPYRFEVHRWIIEILLSTERGREAQNQSAKSLKMLGESPRALTLAASTYLKNPISKDKAKSLLQKALEISEHYTKAVFFLAQILIDDKEHKAAIKLLEKTAAVVSNVKICLILADLFAKSKNLSQALDYYTKVLNLDSTNRHALNGLMALGSTNSNLEKALEVSSTTENDESSAELDPSGENSSRMKTNEEDDDSELVWSDVEMDTA